MRYTYPAILTKNELGGYSVQFIDFKEGYTDGDDIADAADMAAEVLEILIDDYIRKGKALPEPSFGIPQNDLVIAVSVSVDTAGMLVKSSEAADMLGVSAARVRQLILSGQLSSKKQGRDNYVYMWSVQNRLEDTPQAGRPKAAR